MIKRLVIKDHLVCFKVCDDRLVRVSKSDSPQYGRCISLRDQNITLCDRGFRNAFLKTFGDAARLPARAADSFHHVWPEWIRR